MRRVLLVATILVTGAWLGNCPAQAYVEGPWCAVQSLGQGSVTDVVLAVSRAEMALQTATTLRDKVVAAYQDVMRMPI